MALNQLTARPTTPSIFADHLKVLLMMFFGGPLFFVVLFFSSLLLFRQKTFLWFQQQPGYLRHIQQLPALEFKGKRGTIFVLWFYFVLPLMLVWWGTIFLMMLSYSYEYIFFDAFPFYIPLIALVSVFSLMWLRGRYIFFQKPYSFDQSEQLNPTNEASKKKSKKSIQNFFKMLFIIAGFGPVLTLLMPISIGALFFNKVRKWFREQPGYIYFLSYLPALGRTSKRGMILGVFLYFAVPVIVFWLLIGQGLYLIDRYQFPDDPYSFVDVLILVLTPLLIGSTPFAWLSMMIGYSWLTGKAGFFKAEIDAGNRAKDQKADLRGFTPEMRKANLRSLLGISTIDGLIVHEQRSAILTHYLTRLPRFVWWIVLLVGVPTVLSTFLATGWIIGLAGAVLSFVPRYRRWLQNQPGTINRLGLLRGWRSKNPFILAFVHFYYFGILSAIASGFGLFWIELEFGLVADLSFGLWVYTLYGLTMAPIVLPLFLGWLIRFWEFPIPGLNKIMGLNRGVRKWRRNLKTAVNLHQQELFNEAIDLLEETEAYCKKRFGDNHFTRSITLRELGRNYLKIGDYSKSIASYTQVIIICQRGVGKVSYPTANSQYRLGKLHVHLGHFTKAIPQFKQAIKTFHLLGGESNRAYGKALNDLGYAYLNLNHVEIAHTLFEEAESIQKELFVEDWADTVNHLALLHTMQGHVKKGIVKADHYKEANRYFELLEQHKDFISKHVQSWVGINRAAYFQNNKQFELALEWQIKALENERSLYYDTHLTIGKYQKQLADILRDLGRYDEALIHYTDAKGIYYLHDELTHPEFLDCLFGSAKLHAAIGNYQAAFDDMNFALAQEEKIVGQTLAFGSENGRLAFIKTKHDRMILFLELIRQHLSENPDALRAASIILRRQSLIADVSSATKTVHFNSDPKTQKLIHKLEALNKEIGFFEADGSRRDESEVVFNRKRLEKYAERERLETELSQHLPFDQIMEKINQATWISISKALPENSVMLQFVYGKRYDFTAVPAQNHSSWGNTQYTLFILHPSDENPTLIDLGDGLEIETAIKSLRKAIDSMRKRGETRPLSEETAEYAKAGQDLVQKIVTPIEKEISGKEHLLIVPDGMFSSLPFEILPINKNEYLLEHFQISYLSAARDILREYNIESQTAPLVIANPDYNLFKSKIDSSGNVSTRNVDLAEETRASLDEEQLGELLEAAPFLSRDIEHRGTVSFSNLANTHEEGEEIAQMLQVEPKLKAEANEHQIKNNRSPMVLHIATHGFFLEQKKQNEKSSFTNHRLLRIQQNDNPLVRSGLALAGANHWLENSPQSNYQENGILNGLDVASLDLTGTELVVLSACDTGLGDFVDGEGVFGLRRAFVMAGAHSLIMSMWKVPDTQTKQLMIEFYNQLLSGVPRAQALRNAQLSIKNNPETSHPFFWGAFICQGAFDSL